MEESDSFRAMDTAVDVVVHSDRRPVAEFLSVRLLFERQEAMFSRFLPDSLLSRLNRGEVITDATFAAGCRLAVQAQRITGGLFNPMILPALRDAGYSATFAAVSGGRPRPQAVPSPADVLAIRGERVSLVSGQLDLGGVVKGWTVDLAANLLGDLTAVLVNAGGDLRCRGQEPGRDGWFIAVEAPDGRAAWQGDVREAMATSSTRRRRWLAGDREAHHLIDPRTGLPSTSPFVQVTAWGKEAWEAEVIAKAVLIGGPSEAERAAALGYSLLAFDQDSQTVYRCGVATA